MPFPIVLDARVFSSLQEFVRRRHKMEDGEVHRLSILR